MTERAPDVAEGEVVRRRIGAGSKSERDAVVLDAGDRTYVLRRRGGNAFADPALDDLVGRRLRIEGTATETTFVIDQVNVLDPPKRPRRRQRDTQ